MILKGKVIESSPAALLARVADIEGELITQGSVSSVTLTVINTRTDEVTYTGYPVVEDCIYDELQLDGRWGKDSVGYNVAVVIPGIAFDMATSYQAELKITPIEGDAFYVLYELQSIRTYS